MPIFDVVWYDSDMIIGIDASRAFGGDRTGTENYSYHLITQMVRLPEAKSHTFVLFTRPNAVIPDSVRQKNVVIQPIKFRYLWTQVGLAWMTWRTTGMQVLWVPAHTLPVWRKPGIKTVVTIHGLEYEWLPEYRNLLQKWYLPLSTMYAASQSDRLIAVSQFTKNQLVKRLHTTSKKINVVHEGVGESEAVSGDGVKAMLDKYDLAKKKYILFVGSIQPRKNLVELVHAFSLFSRDNPDYKLVVSGGVGWLSEEIMQSPGKYQVSEKVIFTGRVGDQDLDDLYQAAFCYVQPSITEGFGLPVLEAMQHGIPVVSSDGGALPEVVGDAGIIVPVQSRMFASELAHAISGLVSNKLKYQKLVIAGKRRVSEFNWVKAAQTTLNILLTTGQ